MSPNKLNIESTLKSKDTEESLDIIFYRPLGYLMALASKKLGATPNGITIFSIFVGVLAGHLFYYDDMSLNIAGILLLIWAEALDSADGQLARMLNMKSFYGRILDGFGGNLWFISIYIHLCLRFVNHSMSYTVFLLALFCGVSHSLQSAVADYFRNYYLYFVYGKDKSEISKSKNLQPEYQKLSWRSNFFKKFLMRVYINYTVEQEVISGKSLKLLEYYTEEKQDAVPIAISSEYNRLNKKLIKYYNILTTNTRMIVLFISILSGYLMLYFIFEATVLNLLLAYVIFKQNKNSEAILNQAILIDRVQNV